MKRYERLANQISDLIERGDLPPSMGVQMPVTLQPQYSLLSREIEWEIVPPALHDGLGLLPGSPLAGGFLTDKKAGRPARD